VLAWVPTRLREALHLLALGWPPDEGSLTAAWRKAALANHPDRGGTHESFVAVQQAREVVEEALKRPAPSALG
jgi:curved DNA-binding protein CbpA